MSRVAPGLAVVFALQTALALAQAGPQLDVLELDESPEQAVQRMLEARRNAASERTERRGQAPDVGPFNPEDSLGARGLTGVIETGDLESAGDIEDADVLGRIRNAPDWKDLVGIDPGADDKDDKDDKDEKDDKEDKDEKDDKDDKDGKKDGG